MLVDLSNEELYEKYVLSNYDNTYLNILIEKNMGAITQTANAYKTKFDDIDDLIQTGKLGFIEAVKKYNPDKNVKLITYATWWIRCHIAKATELRFNIRVPSHIQSLSNKNHLNSQEIMLSAISTANLEIADSNMHDDVLETIADQNNNTLEIINTKILVEKLIEVSESLTDFQKAVLSNKFNVDFNHKYSYDFNCINSVRLNYIERLALMKLKKIINNLDISA